MAMLSDGLFKLFNRQYCTEVGNFGVFQNHANQAGNLAWDGLSFKI